MDVPTSRRSPRPVAHRAGAGPDRRSGPVPRADQLSDGLGRALPSKAGATGTMVSQEPYAPFSAAWAAVTTCP